MHIYLINLTRRPDRLAKMDAALTALGLPYTRIEAVDGLSLTATAAMPAAAQGCYLSHINAYRAFLETGASHCVIMEDDVVLSPRLPDALKAPIFSDKAITRLEAPTNLQWNLPSYSRPKAVATEKGLSTYALLSKSYGTGAFVMPRNVAEAMVLHHAAPKWPIDLRLFHPRIVGHPEFEIHQISPALAIQRQFLTGEDDSDIRQTEQHPSQWNKTHPMLRNISGNLRGVFRIIARLGGFIRSFPFAKK